LVVEDDGRGIPEGGRDTGLGLLTMARRAEMLEGELDIHTAAGKGTRITCLASYSQ
jgi:signal transduction histidine kinase